MKNILRRLWNDDSGAVLSVEWTLLTGVMVMGVSGGAVAVRDAVNRNMQNMAKSIDALTPQPNFSGYATPSATVAGVQSPAPQYYFTKPESTPPQQIVIVVPQHLIPPSP